MNKGNLNKLVTNYPVSLTNEEVENLSLTLSAVRTAGGGGGEGKTYTGEGYVSVNNTNNTISLTTKANEKLNQPIPTKVSDLTDSANYQTTAGMNDYLTKASASENLAPLSITADIDALKAVSGDFSLYYKKTETSSKEALKTAFGSKQDNLTQEQLSAISSVSSIKGTILTGDTNILATSAEDGNNIKWTLELTAKPVVTDTTLSGYDGIVATKDSTVSSQWNVGIAQAYKEQIEAVSSKLTQDDADTLYAPISVTGDVDTLKSSSGDWNKVNDKLDTSAFSTVSGKFLTAHQSLDDYYTKTQVDSTFASATQLNDYLTTAKYQTDSATFALKSEIPTKVSDLTDSANYYKTTETSSKDELSTEFAKYVTTALLDTVSSTLNDDIEYVSGQVDNKVNKPTEGNKIFVYQTTGTITSGWEEIPIELDKSGRNFAIGVENEFVERGSTTDILLQGYQNSGTYVDFAQGYQNSAFQYGISQGYQNIANYESMAQGYINTAINIALAQGSTNSANYQAFAQGILNKANYDSLAQGHSNSAVDQSIAQGLENTAYHYSFAQGYNNKADMQSFAQGADNRASYYSQTIGHNLIASGFEEDDYYYGLFAIGGYNATTSNALFVVGNGSSYNGVPTRSDAFVIYKDGSVSAKGDISANGVKLGPGGGTSYQGRNGVNVDGGYIELTQTAYNAITSVSSKVDKPDTTQTVLNNNYLIYSTLTGAGTTTGWMPLSANYYSKTESDGRYVATANVGAGLYYSGSSPKLGVKLGTDLAFNATTSAIQINTNGTAYGAYAFVEGSNTTASGAGAHAEGVDAGASGQGAHAGGYGTHTTGVGNFIHGTFLNFASPDGTTNSNTPVFVGGTLNATTAQNYNDHGGYLQIMGNGVYRSAGQGDNSDAYILYRDGTVSAKQFQNANGTETINGTTYNFTGVDNIEILPNAATANTANFPNDNVLRFILES